MSDPRAQEAPLTATTGIDDLAGRFLATVIRRKDKVKFIRPWDLWELDEQFFQALSQWTFDNPERPLDRVLENVRNHIENFQDFIQAVPDSPFPARSLVIALSHLLKLGVTVRRAQKDVQEFAKDVIRWVGLVKSSFELAKDQEFTRRAWRDLKDMRELVDKICLWATERLNDGRWLRIGHGLMIHKEITEFNERIANARALFQDLSAINLARGLDAILQKLRNVILSQQTIMREIQALRKTQKKQLDRIVSEMDMRKEVAERERIFAQTLAVHAIATPSYDSEGKRPCDSDTRVAVLDDIRKWRNNIKRGSPNFLWLTGDPGCGKSAVTASFARECKDEGILWAQFFINRNNARTTDPRSYFPSIARQLADYSPEVAKTIHHTLAQQRSLADDISDDQAAHLFTHSIRKASELDPDRPVVVVIDGLDETKHDRLNDTSKIFSTLFTMLHSCGNIKVLISSRTENEIQRSFVLPIYEKHVKRVHLDTADPSSIRDVSLYIKRNLLNLVTTYDLNWDVWPGDERSRALGERASGHFIWAVTAIKFLEEQIELDRTESLNSVLDMLTAEVLHDINALYSLILSIRHGGRQSAWDSERFRRIVGAIVFLQEPLCIDDLATLLDLRKEPSSELVDIAHFVRRFRTILVTGTDAIDGKTVPRIHKSVFEFVTSNSIDPKFRVNPDYAHLELGIQCLIHLSTARDSVADDTLPIPFRYASRFWSSHLSQAEILGPKIFCVDGSSTASPLSGSVNPPSLAGKPIQIQYSAPASETTVAVKWPVTWDAVSGANKSHGFLHSQESATSIAFLPGGNDILSCSNDKTIKVFNVTNDQNVRTFAEHSSELNAIASSTDGKKIIAGSHDGSVYVWDYATAALIRQPLQRHQDSVLCIACSPDGERIVSGSADNTLILWDARNGQAIGEPWTGHSIAVRWVAFSNNSWRICSIDASGLCIIWDVSTRQKIKEWKYGFFSPNCLSFSPADDDVVAVGGSNGIEVRSNDRSWTIPQSENTRSLSFSLDGKEIIFYNFDAISVAEVIQDKSTARIVRKGNFPTASHMASPTFSPDFALFVYVDEAHIIHPFSLHHTKTSLKVVAIDTWKRTKLAPNVDSGRELKAALSNMNRAEDIHNTIQATNRRLHGFNWYETDANVTESAIKVCVVTDDVVIAGHNDSSVSVWGQRDMGEDEEQRGTVSLPASATAQDPI